MTMPNFLILGAAKAGTSSLHYYLNQHPNVFMSDVKEPRFFALEKETLSFNNPDQQINHDSVTNLADYQSLFSSVTTESAIGEASPLYLYSSKAVRQIQHYVPEAKLIIVLRNPVERAFSCYTHLLREGYETLPFDEALAQEDTRIANNWAHLWHYKRGGLYYEQVKQYVDAFDSAQLKIYLYEDLRADSVGLVQNMFAYLDVDCSFVPDMTKRNVSGIPKHMMLQKFFKRKNVVRSAIKSIVPAKARSQVAQKVKEWNLGDKPELSSDSRQALVNYFKVDNMKLQALIGRDLSSWMC